MSQVEDAFKAKIAASAALSGWTVLVAESVDIAIEEEDLPAIIITTMGHSFDVADENWMTIHTQIVSVEAVSQISASGLLNRANRNALAHVLAAIAADRSLGIKLQDVQEEDIAPTEPGGKDMGSASIQFRATYFTPRDDWFTIP